MPTALPTRHIRVASCPFSFVLLFSSGPRHFSLTSTLILCALLFRHLFSLIFSFVSVFFHIVTLFAHCIHAKTKSHIANNTRGAQILQSTPDLFFAALPTTVKDSLRPSLICPSSRFASLYSSIRPKAHFVRLDGQASRLINHTMASGPRSSRRLSARCKYPTSIR